MEPGTNIILLAEIIRVVSNFLVIVINMAAVRASEVRTTLALVSVGF